MKDVSISIRNISKTFPGVKALDDVSLDFHRGEIHALVGENGAGKSTLIKILMGAYTPDRGRGEILIDGQKAVLNNPIQAEESGLAAVYQHMMLAQQLTVAENIFLGRQPIQNRVINWKQMNAMAKERLDELSLDIDPKVKVASLTPVQQEMVAICKAVTRDAKILIFDEPTALLADEETQQLHRTMLQLRDRGITIIYISHRIDEIFEVSERVSVLRDGKYVGTEMVTDVTEADIIRMMVGRELTELYHKEDVTIGKEVLKVTELTRLPKVKKVSFSVCSGEIFGMFGLIGSGRTELVRCIFGADHYHSGTIEMDGQPMQIRSPLKAIDEKIGLIPEDRHTQGVAMPLSVEVNCNLVSSRYNARFGLLRHSLEKKIAQDNVRSLNIRTPHLDQKMKFLSGGNQQKVVIAKWLNVDSKVLIFDEPTVGVDVGAKTEIYKLMGQLLKQGKGVVFISSYLPELLGVCDRIGVIADGRMTGILDRHEATQERLLELATQFDSGTGL